MFQSSEWASVRHSSVYYYTYILIFGRVVRLSEICCAMRWELTEIGENPMKLVRVRGTSKRQREPKVLSVTQFRLLLGELDEPFRTMVILDLATGLRCSELFGLKWCDVLWDDLTLLVRRGIVTGIVSDVKTKYSNAGMPLDPALAEVLLNWRRKTRFKN